MSPAGEANQAPERGAEARRLARRLREGALATQSARLPGYPYVSALPFCTDQSGRIVVLASHLAEHTRNALLDARAAFLVSGSGPNIQEQPRLTQVGALAPIEDEAASARYLRLFPEAAELLGIGGFRFFRLEPVSLRYIAGFGSIHTLSPGSYLAEAGTLAQAEPEILEHMNRDHAHNLRDYCRHVHGMTVGDCEMAGLDCDGFDVRAGGRLLRFEFPQTVHDAAGARQALVQLAASARP
jgi:putative heme iron utilization protein